MVEQPEAEAYGYAYTAGRCRYLAIAAEALCGLTPKHLLDEDAESACPAHPGTIEFEGWCLGWQSEQAKLADRRRDVPREYSALETLSAVWNRDGDSPPPLATLWDSYLAGLRVGMSATLGLPVPVGDEQEPVAIPGCDFRDVLAMFRLGESRGTILYDCDPTCMREFLQRVDDGDPACVRTMGWLGMTVPALVPWDEVAHVEA